MVNRPVRQSAPVWAPWLDQPPPPFDSGHVFNCQFSQNKYKLYNLLQYNSSLR